MPRHPDVAPVIAEMPGAIYSALADRLARFPGEVYPFHVGDTWLEPAVGCRMQDLTVEAHPGMHRYASPAGMPALNEAIARRVEARSGLATSPSSVLVAAGATGGLGAVIGAIVDPGDEVLIAAPFWPLIGGIVRCFRGRPCPVPLVGTVSSAEEAVAAYESRATDRTVAVYLSTPNNPSGRLLPPDWIRAIVDWARHRDLWVLSDEVYEDYVYEGEHLYARPLAPERTFAAHSFSKAFGMAGNRCGYIVGPEKLVPELGKLSTHAFYSTPTASQLAAIRALDGSGDAWVDDVRPRYAELGRLAADRLGLPHPQGSQFLFLDIAEQLDDRGLNGWLSDCADEGLLLAPGPSFGPYPTHVRLCFTACEPDRFARGLEIVARRLGR